MAMSAAKMNLLKEGKELGLNLDDTLSIVELQKLLDEEKKKKNPKPKEQKSPKKGEY